jgi:zinc/manganese transport system ATP-binding protein
LFLESRAPTSGAKSTLVEAKNLSAGYPGRRVWDNANFVVNKGEFVAIIGPNGAGKTTLFRLLLGLQKPIGGTVKVFGEEPRRGSPWIGYVPQRHVIDQESHIESVELVKLGVSGTKWGFGLVHHGDAEAAHSALRAVGGEALAHRPLAELSGGELQRIFLAEALVSSPYLLLLDEPLSNLDIRHERDQVALLDQIVRTRDVAALLIAHNINPLMPYLDRIIYIANGKVASGKPTEVLTTESLSALYGVRVEVLHDSSGNVAVVGVEGFHGGE